MKSATFICLLLISACQNETNKSQIKTNFLKDSLRNSLIGKWGGQNESGPVLRITFDSIYYYQENKSYTYNIVGSDLIIERGEFQPKLKDITVKLDTLFFYQNESLGDEVYSEVRAYRYK